VTTEARAERSEPYSFKRSNANLNGRVLEFRQKMAGALGGDRRPALMAA
jgi:hypothetical protein